MRNGTGWLGENPSYWEGAGSTSVERVTQWTVVDIEGRRVVVGRDGTPALVGLGTSVPGFKGGRRRLVAVCCQAMVFCGSLLGCRGALTRQKTTSVGWIPVFAKSLGVTEALGESPWVAFMAWDDDTLGFLSSNNC